MKSRTFRCFTAITLFASMAVSVQLAAQHTRYKLVNLGTLGGPNSYPSVNGNGTQILNNAGIVSSSADTSTPDPNAPNLCFNPDCFLAHAFRWRDGVLTDLGAIHGVIGSSAAGAINARGWSVGQSQNGAIDPLTGFPEIRAVLWRKDGQIIDLGTLGGNLSLASTLNNGGQVVGFSTINDLPDPFSLFIGASIHPFLWEKGTMQDLGTLGGPDAAALSVNERGQVAGFSFTDSSPNATTGIPTLEPFLWEHGRMISLGTFGGTVGSPGREGSIMINNRGQIIGTSNLAGDQFTHPFVWENGVLTDLGTLGGHNGFPLWINDAGEIVGEADLPGQFPHHAFLWRNGVMTDLGTLGSTSHAEAINDRGQVVGRSRIGSPKSQSFSMRFCGSMADP